MQVAHVLDHVDVEITVPLPVEPGGVEARAARGAWVQVVAVDHEPTGAVPEEQEVRPRAVLGVGLAGVHHGVEVRGAVAVQVSGAQLLDHRALEVRVGRQRRQGALGEAGAVPQPHAGGLAAEEQIQPAVGVDVRRRRHPGAVATREGLPVEALAVAPVQLRHVVGEAHHHVQVPVGVDVQDRQAAPFAVGAVDPGAAGEAPGLSHLGPGRHLCGPLAGLDRARCHREVTAADALSGVVHDSVGAGQQQGDHEAHHSRGL